MKKSLKIFKGYIVLKSCGCRINAIIIILVVFFSIPIKGIAQTEDNKIGSKKQNTNSHLSSPTKSPRKNKSSQKKFPRKKFKISKNKIPAINKSLKKNKLSTGSVNTSSKFKALEKKLSIANKQLAKSKKSDTQKGVEIKKLKSDSAKLSGEIKVLEKKLSLAKAELKDLKETDSKKNEELIKLNENINFLLDSIDDQKDELAELSIHSKTSEKYKEIIKCYRAALFSWNNLVSRQSLTEKEYLVVTVELRRSLFACPPT